MIYRKLHNWRPHTRFKFLESTNEILAVSDVAEMIQIKQLYLAPFGGQQSLVLKTGKHSAHSFFCDSEVIADIAARHAQVEFGWGVSASLEALRYAQQEGGQAFIGTLLTQQQHQFLIIADFLAQNLEHLLADRGNFLAVCLQHFNGNFAHHRGFQCHRFGGEVMGCNGPQTEQFTRNMKPRDLHPAIASQDIGLDGTSAYCIDGAYRLICPVKQLATLDHPAVLD